jgi:hypothetical protein
MYLFCMYVYMYVCMYVRMNVCNVCTYVNVCMCICKNALRYVCMYVRSAMEKFLSVGVLCAFCVLTDVSLHEHSSSSPSVQRFRCEQYPIQSTYDAPYVFPPPFSFSFCCVTHSLQRPVLKDPKIVCGFYIPNLNQIYQ